MDFYFILKILHMREDKNVQICLVFDSFKISLKIEDLKRLSYYEISFDNIHSACWIGLMILLNHHYERKPEMFKFYVFFLRGCMWLYDTGVIFRWRFCLLLKFKVLWKIKIFWKSKKSKINPDKHNPQRKKSLNIKG
jgi:hypothetical protein